MAKSANILIKLVCFGFLLSDVAALASLPDDILFRISRSRDADEIFYEASLGSDGRLDPGSPVNIYWVRKAKGLQREPLTWIQNRYSYGIKFLETSSDHAIFKFVSFDSKEFKLEKSAEGQFRVYTVLDNRQVIVERIFIQFNGGTFLAPVISEVILYGRDVESGVLLTEDIRP
jgi:hypothetical protein